MNEEKERKSKMKKVFFALLIVGLLFSVGCSKEFMEHDTVYKTNQHMMYSLFGYENPDKDIQTVQAEQGGWWGESYDMNGEKIK